MDHLSPDYLLAAEILVASAAVCAGVALAKLRFPSAETQLRRGDCPECKSRKSLRTTPIGTKQVMLTCGDCVSQWLLESDDGDDIVIYGPADEPYIPKLTMTHNHEVGLLIFTTEAGIACFDLLDLDRLNQWGLQGAETPRQKIAYLYHALVQPAKVDLTPQQSMKAVIAECTPYQWFAASAGVDIYHLMPGWADGLHGTREKTDD